MFAIGQKEKKREEEITTAVPESPSKRTCHATLASPTRLVVGHR